MPLGGGGLTIEPLQTYHTGDSQNSTTQTTWVQLDARSAFINFDEIPKYAGYDLQMRFIADFRTTVGTIAAYVRITNDPDAGATPAGATRAELNTLSTTFDHQFSSWWSVNNWTGIHEFNISFYISGVATAYVNATAIQFRYVKV